MCARIEAWRRASLFGQNEPPPIWINPMTTQDGKRPADPKPNEQAKVGPEAAKASVVSMANFASDASNDARKAVQDGMGAAADGFRRASDQLTRIYGFDGEEGQ